MRVPFFDLGAIHASLRHDLLEALTTVMNDDAYILGPAVKHFEESFASYVGRRFCVAVSSGTAALHLALLTVNVRPGDEVITTPFSWISTSWAISYCGARPVFADVESTTGNLDASEVESRITDRTRAILPADMYGNPSRLDAFSSLASSHGLALVDDACQAHGSRLHGKAVGSFGDVACFSFYPGKNLGALGEGGAVVTDSEAVDARLRRLRDHAQQTPHHHSELGFNYRMDGFQGAALGVKLKWLDEWNAARRRAADVYLAELSHVSEVGPPSVTPGGEPNWHLFVVRVADRELVRERLAESGIETRIHYPVPIHLQPAYSHLGYQRGAFPRAEEFARTCLSLPMSQVITSEQQDAVAQALAKAVRRTDR